MNTSRPLHTAYDADGPARLVIDDGLHAQTVTLGSTPQRLGRAPDNDVVIALPFISGYHARIEPADKGHLIIDLESTNGLLLGGQRVTRHQLCHGDVLRVGDPVIGSLVTLTYLNPHVPSALVKEPQRFALKPGQNGFTIGRMRCDIELANPSVSRFHAQLDRLPDGQFLLRDNHSSNGTFVNGQRISQHRLQIGDSIQIGPYQLIFTGHELKRSDQRSTLQLSAHDLIYTVQAQGQAKHLLHAISLVIESREFVALVGGSGAGKSTLLKALAGMHVPSMGSVRFNGEDLYQRYDSYRTLIGYVPQEDTIHEVLPVTRALSYIGRLRLPADTSPAELNQRIEQTLTTMELEAHRYKSVRNLSGGQRKRVSIASELIADPGVCFLDEASSGLDPGLEKRLMFTLRQLADAGKMVILVTHATENIAQCDLVAFLAQGRLVFFGPPAAALNFFAITSDNFADIYLKLEGAANPQSQLVQRELQAEYQAWQQAHPGLLAPPSLAELWEQRFRQTPLYQQYIVNRLGKIPVTAPGVKPEADRPRPRFSFWHQFQTLTSRYLDVIWQDRRYLLLLLLQAPLIALLIASITPTDALVGVFDSDLIQRNEARKLLFMLMSAGLWFGISNAVLEIVKERHVIGREWFANLRISSYLTSKLVVLALLAFVQTALLLLLIAPKVTLTLSSPVLFAVPIELGITLTFTTLAATALGLVVSASTRTPEQASGILPLLIIPQLLFAGMLFAVEQPFSQILAWLTISRWSMDALGSSVRLNELCELPNMGGGRTACLEPAVPDPLLPAVLSIGEHDMLVAFTPTGSHLGLMWMILGLWSIGGVALSAWQLRRHARSVN